MTNCSKCGKEVSERATTCPHCGEVGPALSEEQKRKIENFEKINNIALGVVGIIIILCIIGIVGLNLS